MNITELREILKEDIREVFKAEFKDILIEAVQALSNPSNPVVPAQVGTKPVAPVRMSSVNEILEATRKSMTSQEYSNIMGGVPTAPMFESTAQPTVTSTEYISEGSAGVDLSMFPGMANAKLKLDLMNEKSKSRTGGL